MLCTRCVRRGGRADDWLDLPPEPAPLEEVEFDWEGIYCWDCMMWTNGPTQFEEHSAGKKHRKQVRRNARARAST